MDYSTRANIFQPQKSSKQILDGADNLSDYIDACDEIISKAEAAKKELKAGKIGTNVAGFSGALVRFSNSEVYKKYHK